MMTARADIVSHLKRGGIDLAWQPMEVAPGLHSHLGGLRIDENAESMTIEGLYAAGEASGGWGGSNRLGGNAISAALGLGVIAGESAAQRSERVSVPRIDVRQVEEERERIEEIGNRKEGVKPQTVKSQVQDLMQRNVWLRRDEKGLRATVEELQKIEKNSLPMLCVPRGREMQRYLWLREALEAINLVKCGQVVANAALARTESRGSHQRADYPRTDNTNWLKNIIQWQEKGDARIRTEPVIVTEVPLPQKKNEGE
jgi:succinate dehydrogenase/fumarate reductase flavoprotein subunit